MTKTEILSNLGVGSGINTTELIKALVDADTAPQKENLDNLEEKTKDKISTFGILKSNLLDFKNILKIVTDGKELNYQLSKSAFEIIMSGKATDAQISSF